MDAPDFELPDGPWLTKFRRRLLSWYRPNARSLPWRETHDPYKIWVSEIMLQQTQVETVIPYYHRFLDRFPNVTALANAEVEEVLRHWEGLGYYRRARQLHAAAIEISTQHGGVVPTNFEQVLALPGIGRYTAGAILSFAHDQRQPILEANTIRLYSRLIAYPDCVTKSAGQKVLWRFAEDVLPRKNVGEVNQALMELGSLICKPSPQCEACPVAELCTARAENTVDTIPQLSKKMVYEKRHEAAIVVRDAKDRILMRLCQPEERWAGLWDFPRFHLTSKPPRQRRQLQELASEKVGAEIAVGELLLTIKHGVTRYRITLDCYEANLRRHIRVAAPLKWVPFDQFDELPLSTTGRKIADHIGGLTANDANPANTIHP